MNLALSALVTLTLVVAGSVAVLPDLWHERQPRARQRPATVSLVPPLWVVRSGSGRWFVDGGPISPAALAQRLRTDRDGEVHLLVSSQLSTAEAARSLRWLRSHGPRAVLLELPARSP